MCGFRKHKNLLLFRCFFWFQPDDEVLLLLDDLVREILSAVFSLASWRMPQIKSESFFFLSPSFLLPSVLRLHKLENWNIHGNFPSPASRIRLPMCTPNKVLQIYISFTRWCMKGWRCSSHGILLLQHLCENYSHTAWSIRLNVPRYKMPYWFMLAFSIPFLSSLFTKIILFRVFFTMMHLTVSQRSVFSKKKCSQIFDSTVLEKGEKCS